MRGGWRAGLLQPFFGKGRGSCLKGSGRDWGFAKAVPSPFRDGSAFVQGVGFFTQGSALGMVIGGTVACDRIETAKRGTAPSHLRNDTERGGAGPGAHGVPLSACVAQRHPQMASSAVIGLLFPRAKKSDSLARRKALKRPVDRLLPEGLITFAEYSAWSQFSLAGFPLCSVVGLLVMAAASRRHPA